MREEGRMRVRIECVSLSEWLCLLNILHEKCREMRKSEEKRCIGQ